MTAWEAERRTAHIAELRKRAAEAEAKLKRLYDAIENGNADVSDPMLKERVTELKAIRDQARADAERAAGALDRLGPSITPQVLKTFANQARRRMRTESGDYRRDHLRALAQRVEVDAKEVRIMGSKGVLLRTLVAASSAKTAGFGVPSSVSGAPEEIRTPAVRHSSPRTQGDPEFCCHHTRCAG
jgi:site-specific DNA recombinase